MEGMGSFGYEDRIAAQTCKKRTKDRNSAYPGHELIQVGSHALKTIGRCFRVGVAKSNTHGNGGCTPDITSQIWENDGLESKSKILPSDCSKSGIEA
jgi:hypothetical protein